MILVCGWDLAVRHLTDIGRPITDFTHRLEMCSQCVLEIASCLFRGIAGRYDFIGDKPSSVKGAGTAPRILDAIQGHAARTLETAMGTWL